MTTTWRKNPQFILSYIRQVAKYYSAIQIYPYHEILHCRSYVPTYSSSGFEYFAKSGIELEPLMLDKHMIPHYRSLDVGFKISQEQLCSFIRDCHANFLLKNTIFKGEVAWQPLKELRSCSSSILIPPTRAFKWGIVCLSTIVTFEDTSSYVKKCLISPCGSCIL